MHSFTIENNFNNLQKQTTITYMHHEHWKTNPKWQANRLYKYARQDTPHPSQSPIIPPVYWHTHGQNIPEHSCIRTQCMRNSISIKSSACKITNMICIGKYLAHFWTKKYRHLYFVFFLQSLVFIWCILLNNQPFLTFHNYCNYPQKWFLGL